MLKKIKNAIKQYLRTNLNADPKDLIEWQKGNHKYGFRQKLSQDFNQTDEIFDILAKDPEYDIKKEVCKNFAASDSALKILAHDPDKSIRLF